MTLISQSLNAEPLIADLTGLLGAAHVITGPDLARYTADWTTHYTSAPLAVIRPGTTAEVAASLQPANGESGVEEKLSS